MSIEISNYYPRVNLFLTNGLRKWTLNSLNAKFVVGVSIAQSIGWNDKKLTVNSWENLNSFSAEM